MPEANWAQALEADRTKALTRMQKMMRMFKGGGAKKMMRQMEQMRVKF